MCPAKLAEINLNAPSKIPWEFHLGFFSMKLHNSRNLGGKINLQYLLLNGIWFTDQAVATIFSNLTEFDFSVWH